MLDAIGASNHSLRMTTTGPAASPKTVHLSRLARVALRAQVFLIKKNIAGPLGEVAMALTHRGRKTGKAYATPVAFLRDGADVIVLNNGGISNWFKNVLAAGFAEIDLQGVHAQMRARLIDDPEEIARVFKLYRDTSKAFARTFRVSPRASEAELQAARDRFRYLRLSPIRA
jgi:deazaflavin-dependent oxidoreductase (nitroreductase family)